MINIYNIRNTVIRTIRNEDWHCYTTAMITNMYFVCYLGLETKTPQSRLPKGRFIMHIEIFLIIKRTFIIVLFHITQRFIAGTSILYDKHNLC
jgi:hypothetical protein